MSLLSGAFLIITLIIFVVRQQKLLLSYFFVIRSHYLHFGEAYPVDRLKRCQKLYLESLSDCDSVVVMYSFVYSSRDFYDCGRIDNVNHTVEYYLGNKAKVKEKSVTLYVRKREKEKAENIEG